MSEKKIKTIEELDQLFASVNKSVDKLKEIKASIWENRPSDPANKKNLPYNKSNPTPKDPDGDGDNDTTKTGDTDHDFVKAQIDSLADMMYASMDHMRNYMRDAHAYLHDRINNHNSALNNHLNPTDGSIHPLHLKTATQVESYLKACSMDDDVKVKKPELQMRNANMNSVYASEVVKSRSGKSILLQLSKPNKSEEKK